MTTTASRFPIRRIVLRLFTALIGGALLAPVASSAVVPAPGPGPGPGPNALFQLYTVPGACERPDLKIGTVFFCTSLETAKVIHVGIDLRDGLGAVRNPGADNGAADIAPGQTVTIATHDSPAFAEDQVMAISPTIYFRDGVARIFSSSAKVMCSAVLVQDDPGAVAAPAASGPPPAAMFELKVVKAKFQTGD